jgi:murein DD-endopeptidase MepM/ murein hydrolase activator NlpD
MRANRTSGEKAKRFALIAICVVGAALLSGCETYQDARDSYADIYGRSAPRYREARNVRRDVPAAAPTTRVAVREETPITPRKRPVYTPQRQEYAQQDTRVGDTLTSGFVMPVSGTIISGFGSTGGGERNDGINIAAASGTPIHAAADGVVTYAGNELKGYGNLILIKHGDTYVTAYAHTESIGVARGQRVAKGDVIGTVGQTGDVTRPQLHFEIRRNMKPIDPRAILTASNDS